METGPNLLALVSPETTLAMEVCAQKLTSSGKKPEKAKEQSHQNHSFSKYFSLHCMVELWYIFRLQFSSNL